MICHLASQPDQVACSFIMRTASIIGRLLQWPPPATASGFDNVVLGSSPLATTLAARPVGHDTTYDWLL